MNHYKHLTLIERECIMYYCSKGLTVTEIANILNRDKSTVSRELHRNSIGEEYLPYIAQKLYEKRPEHQSIMVVTPTFKNIIEAMRLYDFRTIMAKII